MPVASELLVKIGADSREAEAALDRTSNKIGAFARGAGALGAVGAAAFAGIGLAAVGMGAGIGSAVGTAMDFEAAIDGVGALVNATSAEIDQLSAAALALGQDTRLAGIGASDAARAMAELAAAGFTVSEMTGGVTEGILLLASATGTDVAAAAEIAGDAFNAFRQSMGLVASDMPGLANLFTGLANVSSVTLGDIGSSMKSVAPVAAAMGISIEEVTAALAALGNQGIKGSEAGTALRGVLASLADPSKESKKLIQALGLSFRDSGGEIKDFGGIADELRDKLGGLTAAQREQAIVQLFGRENLAAILALMSEGSEGIDKYAAAIAAQGNAAAIGATRNDNLKGSLQALGGVVETAKIMLGTAFIPAIRSTVDWTARFVQGLIPLIQQWGPRFVAMLTTGIAALLGFGRSVGAAFGAVIEAVRALLSGQTNLGQFIGGMEIWVSTILGKFGELGARIGPVLQTFLGAIGSWVASMAPQVGAQFLVWGQSFTNWITATALPAALAQLAIWQQAILNWLVGSALPGLAPALMALGQGFGQWVATSAIPAVQATLPVWGATIATWIATTALPTVQAALATLGQQFGQWVTTTAIPAVQAAMPAWVQAIVASIQSVGPALAAFRAQLLNAVQGALDVIIPLAERFGQVWQQQLPNVIALGGQLKAIWDELGPAMQAIAPIAQLVAALLGTLIAVQIGVAMAALGGLVGMFSGILPGAIQIVSGSLTVIQGVIQTFAAVVGGVVGIVAALIDGDWAGAWAAAQNLVSEAATGIETIITGLSNMVIGLFNALIGGVVGLVSGFVSTIVGFFQGLYNTLVGGSIVPDMINGIVAQFQRLPGEVAGIVSGWVSTVIGFFASLASQALALVGTLVATVVGLFQSIPPQVSAAMQAVVAAVLGALSGLAGQAGAAAAGIGAAIVSGLTGGILAGAAQVASAAASIVQGALEAAQNALQIRSPSKVFAGVGRDIVRGLVVGMDDEQSEATKKAADLASSVARAVRETLDAMAALAGFDFSKNTPSAGSIGALASFVREATNQIAALAAEWEEEALKHVSAFAQATSTIVGMLGNAVKGLEALADFSPPAVASIYAFGKSLRSLINDFALLAEQITQEATDQAAKFAEGAGKVVGMIGTGVAGFTALADFVAPAASAIYAFGKTLRAVINDLALVAEQVTQEAGDAAALFATSAGSVVGIIGSAVDGLTKLLDFVAPGEEAINNFVYAIAATVRKIAEMASQMSTEGIELAGQFGDAAGSVFGALRDALSVFTDLHDLVVPSAQAIDNFGIAVAYTVRRLGQFAAELGKDGIERAQKFGGSVQAIFGSLKSAMDILTNLHKFKDVAEEAFTSLQKGLQSAIELAQGMVNQSKDMVLLAEEYANNMRKAAALFASGQSLGGVSPEQAGRALGEGVIEGARDAVGARSPAEELAKLGRDITAGLVQGMDETAQEAAKAAADLASSVAKAIQDTLAAAGALGKLDVATLPTGGQIGAVLAFARALVAEMAASAAMLSTEGLAATTAFAEAVGKIGSGVQSALGALGALRGYVQVGRGAIDNFGADLRVAVNDLIYLANEIAIELVEQGTAFGESAAKGVAIFGNAVAGFDALRGYVQVGTAAIYAFGKDLQLAVADLAAIVDIIGQEIADKAGALGEQVAKATGGIANAVAGFLALRDYARVSSAALYGFGKDLLILVADFAAIVDLVGIEMVAKAGQLGEGVGKVTGGIAAAVEGLSAIRDFARVPTGHIDAFAASLGDLVARLAAIAVTFQSSGLDATAALGEAVGKVAGRIDDAVAGLNAIRGFARVPAADIAAFSAGLNDLLGRIVAVAVTFKTTGLDAAGRLGDAVGKVLGSVGSAVSGLRDLFGFISPPASALDAFAASVRDMIARMVVLAGTLNSEGVDAAALLGEALGKVFAGFNAATSFFKSLDNLLLPDRAGIDRLLAPMLHAVGALASLGTVLGPDALARAGAVADLWSRVAGAIEAGNRALTPALAGGGGGTFTGGGNGGNTYVFNFNAPVADRAQVQDWVVAAIEEAERRGRV